MAAKWPEIVAKCSCGEVLVREGSNTHWTRSEAVIGAASKLANLKNNLCPGCGGDASVPMGSFYHPRYLQKI
jgi:hypothetical protein